MCYLKNLNGLEEEAKNMFVMGHSDSERESEMIHGKESSEKSLTGKPEHESYVAPCYEKCCGLPFSHGQIMLMNLYSQLNNNNQMIRTLNDVQYELIQKLTNVIEEETQEDVKVEQVEEEELDLEVQPSHKQMELSTKNKELQLYNKLFHGLSDRKPMTQKYKLILTSHLDHKLYKERNFDIKVKLVSNDSSAVPVKNSNLLNLCIGVFTNDGEWVSENKVKQPILKGKSEVELYDGNAHFQKMFFREISSYYNGGKLNVAIYVKPSTIQFENKNMFSEHIQWDNVYPLFIRNVRVLSRRKTDRDEWAH